MNGCYLREDGVTFECNGLDTGDKQRNCRFFVENNVNGYCFYNPSVTDTCTCPAANYYAVVDGQANRVQL